MILKLIGINYKAMFAALFRASKRTRRKSSTMLLYVFLLLISGLSFIFMFGMMFYGMRDPYFQLGIGWLYFAMMALIVFSLCVFTCIFQAQSQIFNAKDNDLLLSMPIRPSSILTARLLTMLIFEYVFELLVAGPAFVIWIIGGYASVLGTIFFIISFILLPLLALSVACLLAFILSLITSRMRKSNIVSIIIAIVFFGAYFWFSANVSRYMTSLMENGAEIAEAFRRAVPPVYYFGTAVADKSVSGFFIFAACVIIPFILLIILLSAGFTKIVTRNRGAKKVEYRERALKASGSSIALIKKEMARYISKPMIALNMSMGSVLSILAIVYFCLQYDTIMSTLNLLADQVPVLTPAALAAAMLLFCATCSPSTASLISLEGRTMWLARSLPVSGREMLLSKINMHLIVAGVPVTAASVVAAVFMGNSAAGIAALLVSAPVFTWFTALFGLIFNLLHPNFEWVNEIQPVKQGMPVMVTMFGTMLLITAGGLLYGFVFSGFLSLELFILAADAVIAVSCVLMHRWLVTSGERRWEALDA